MEKNKKNEEMVALNIEQLENVSGGTDNNDEYIHCTCGNGDYDKIQFIGMVNGKGYFHCDACRKYFYFDI